MSRAVAGPDRAAAMRGVVRAGALSLDPNAREVWLHGKPVVLPMREFQLLHLLMSHAGRVVTRQEICRSLWGSAARSNTLTVHIGRLRGRLGDTSRGRMIVSVRGLGYRLDPPTSRSPHRRTSPVTM